MPPKKEKASSPSVPGTKKKKDEKEVVLRKSLRQTTKNPTNSSNEAKKKPLAVKSLAGLAKAKQAISMVNTANTSKTKQSQSQSNLISEFPRVFPFVNVNNTSNKKGNDSFLSSDSDISDSEEDCFDSGCYHNYHGGCLYDSDGYDSEYDSYDDFDDYESGCDYLRPNFGFDFDNIPILSSINASDPTHAYSIHAETFLREYMRNPSILPIVRARIHAFLLYVGTQRADDVFLFYVDFRSELAELSRAAVENYPVFNFSTFTSTFPSNSSNRPGLTDSHIAALPRHIYRGQTQKEKRTGEEPHKCCICMAELEIGEELIRLEKCSHRFHFDCLQSWLRKSKQCPVCRDIIKPELVIIN